MLTWCTFSDYHDRWVHDPQPAGACCFGFCVSEEYQYPIPGTYSGIFHQECLNGGDHADYRLCSRLSLFSALTKILDTRLSSTVM